MRIGETTWGDAAASGRHLDGAQRVVYLARSFHVLESAAHDVRGGLAPWDPNKFHLWLHGPQATSATLQAGLFALSVWRGNHNDWVIKVPARKDNPRLWPAKTIRFDAVHAMGVWDDRNRAAFLRWASAPWWP